MLKSNAEFVDVVFSLMFDTFWVPPYDRRRSHPVLIDFERRARHTSLLLSITDTASASEAQMRELQQAVALLAQSVGRLGEENLFVPGVCAEAAAELKRIEAALPAGCTVEI